jgi:hypothetical protein
VVGININGVIAALEKIHSSRKTAM